MGDEERQKLLHNGNQNEYRSIPSSTMSNQDNDKIGVSSVTLVSTNETAEYGTARRLPQYIAAIAVTLGAFSAGTMLGWSSPAGTPLQDGKMGFDVSKEQFSWIGALVCIGAAVICYPIAVIMNLIGRKITMLSLIVPFTVGWCLIYWADSVDMLYAGRFFTGLAGGAFCLTAPLYTTEIAEKEIRGTLGSYFQLLLTVGILYVYTIGAFAPLSTVSLTCLIIPFIFVLAFVFQPETPVYYVKKGKIEEARKSLRYFRGPDYNVELEIQDMITLNNEMINSNVSVADILKTKASKKAILIAFGLMFFQQLSGVNAVIFYSGGIFTDAKVGIPANQATIIVAVMQVVATFIASLVVDKLGRRILLLASDFVMAVCSILLAVYFSWTEEQRQSIAWLPILALSVFIILFSLGFGPIPWMMVGEIVPKEIRSELSSIACVFNWLLAFIVTKFYEPLSTAVGADTTFYIFAAISFIGTIFVFFIVPETKGKTLEQIQIELGGGSERGVVIHPEGGPHVNEAYVKNDNV